MLSKELNAEVKYGRGQLGKAVHRHSLRELELSTELQPDHFMTAYKTLKTQSYHVCYSIPIWSRCKEWTKCPFAWPERMVITRRQRTKDLLLRRKLQRKRHIKIELCVMLSLTRLFHVGYVVQIRRSALSLAWHEWFSCKGKEWKIYCCELALSSESQIWKFHVFVCQTTSKHCIKKRAARAARLFFFIQPIKSLICGGVVDVAVVKS